MPKTPLTQKAVTCYHCGEAVGADEIVMQDKHFCCSGCKMVYEILDNAGLCEYYSIDQAPGNSLRKVRADQFAFLDDPKAQQGVIRFQDDQQTHVELYLPQIHCSSCLWLLEHLHQLNPAVISCKVHFEKKQVSVRYQHRNFTLRNLAELLTSIGYEPYFSLQNLHLKQAPVNRGKIFRLGVAGFCFSNIMLMSFPEYFGIDTQEQMLQQVFRYANLVLSLPVFFL